MRSRAPEKYHYENISGIARDNNMYRAHETRMNKRNCFVRVCVHTLCFGLRQRVEIAPSRMTDLLVERNESAK